ncbi:MAG: GNAT family N-acetyltransferase [Candidatus Bathyarchaeota archaeon]|nr:GNAT family N-acetyltransferase [Candidatus Bathyarchaeota archaeon]
MQGINEPDIGELTIRFAEEEDASTIFEMVKELATYENLLDQLEATEQLIEQELFQRKIAEALIAEYQGKAVGYAIFFQSFSSFVGRRGIYIEDLYVKPEMRGKGFGKALFSAIAELAMARNCGRLEWACLDWNAPSIEFYKKTGASAMDQWTVYRLTDKDLQTRLR